MIITDLKDSFVKADNKEVIKAFVGVTGVVLLMKKVLNVLADSERLGA